MALSEDFVREIAFRTNFTGGLQTGNNAIAESAVARIYELLGRSAPAIVWCKSPYQLATLSSILIGLFFSDAWQIARGALAEREPDEIWERDYDEAWDALWAHGGQQLLKGMKNSSRIGTQYWELEAALFQQCKQQMKLWMQSGKIHKFEEKLPKETIYRKFWAMQLWHLNFVQDRLRILEAELIEQLIGESDVWDKQMQQFLPFQNRLVESYLAAESAILSIINRMGAEPANQLKHCVWLPMSLPFAASCQIWIDNVHSQAFPAYTEEIAAWNRLAKSTAGVICLDHIVFACEKPSVFSIDEGGRLHNASGPALIFADGFIEYGWHGVIVEPRIIMEPESITIDEIESTANAEIRRVLIERYGQSRYLHDSGAEQIQQDDFGTLYRKEIPGDEPLVMVKVVNSSPEPDGSFKDYFLRVPPDMATAKQAVAWTFGFDEEDYTPLMES